MYRTWLKEMSISYNMGKRDLPDIYAQARGRWHIYQENPECPHDVITTILHDTSTYVGNKSTKSLETHNHN